jgi:MFS family permease
MAYGFSVFWLPLSHAIGITKSVDCPADTTFLQSLFSTTCDWKVSTLGWMFTLFFVFLGSSTAVLGKWVEREGPRKAGAVAALCWGGGFFISAAGIYLHQVWLIWLGSGVIGGIGLGLGYISPVSTLIKWFPDRRGMATGMAIMGFGGGAMIGAPLANLLMNKFATPTSVGVWETFVVMGFLYLLFMLGGALGYRVAPVGYRPKGWTPTTNAQTMITAQQVHVRDVLKTPQFWLIWWVLCLNVTAGIGILGMASPMLQEIFAGKLIGSALTFDQLTTAQKATIAGIAAGFTGLLSLFNIGGRIFWASLSDFIGRKATYFIFFTLGCLLYVSANPSAQGGHIALFVGAFGIILSMYGGGFATIPAYLADIFGTQMVGAIHGRLLTAWSAAGIFGPVIVNYIREYQLSHGVAKADVYSITTYILAGLLVVGFICNLLIRPVNEKYHMSKEQLDNERKIAHELPSQSLAFEEKDSTKNGIVSVTLAWLAVGIPLAWGVWVTVQSAWVLFT